MKFSDYIKEKAVVLLLHILMISLLCGFLFLTNNAVSNIIMIIVVWWFVLFVYFGIVFYQRKRYFDKILNVLQELDKKYLISEVIRPGYSIEDKLYFDILRTSNKSVLDQIKEIEQQSKEYKDYLESWIHEVKTPLTSLELICENNKNDMTDKMEYELGKIENLVDMVLYYARSEKAYQDYLINPTSLRNIVIAAIQKNKPYFLQNQIKLELNMEDVVVSTDAKWVGFLLDQIFINAIKYRKSENSFIQISTIIDKQKVSLMITDNGIGIKAEDQKRIFEKGFTGQNGRIGKKSTGMGLYLCKRICDRLDIGICCKSEEQRFTSIILTFPNSDHNLILQK